MATITEALTLALDLHIAGRLGEAQELYARILDADPDQPDALHFLGVLTGQVGQGEVGLPLIARALVFRPEAEDIHANRGNLLRGLERLGEAADAYRRALALRPDFAEAWTDHASALRGLGDGDGAIAALGRAVRAAPDLEAARERLAALLHERGRLLIEAGRASLALPFLFRAVELAPLDADLAFLLGNALYAADLREDSLAPYRRALMLVPDFLSATLNLGIALGQTGRPDVAVAVLSHAVRIDPTHLDALENLIPALYALGREAEANVWAGAALREKNRQAVAHAPALPELPAAPRAAEARTRDVVVFGLWGSSAPHRQGAIENARLVPVLYPGWICRIYHDDSTPAAILAELAASGAELVAMAPGSGARSGPYWRFFASDDPTVRRFLCRDCGSRVGPGEAAAVKAWIASEQPFHIMRTHVLQTDLIPAGQWGGIAGLLPELRGLAERFARADTSRRPEQGFLRRFVWPAIRDHALIHDRTHDGLGLPFPDGADGPFDGSTAFRGGQA
ncbi:tetratricopeptide (TPR) repeat protein [Azospirillum agricola]|uniref:tetratricopeptide repeat protein n=1 Tax=Azospirillum agricola TaxID=1720247 RepID=UPI001AEA7F5C|nr:tetratricopeptide repeat protein [Azospirillum agricola]MBP2230515.1 tetratricopeptide (TPR) repeat protein [Azospirillum agricola]